MLDFLMFDRLGNFIVLCSFGYLLVRYLIDTHKEKKSKRLKEKGD